MNTLGQPLQSPIVVTFDCVFASTKRATSFARGGRAHFLKSTPFWSSANHHHVRKVVTVTLEIEQTLSDVSLTQDIDTFVETIKHDCSAPEGGVGMLFVAQWVGL